MGFVLIVLIFLAGMFDLYMAGSFLFTPLDAASGLGVTAIGLMGGAQGAAAGISTIRADFTAFFGVSALCMMWGAWRRNGDLVLVPGLLFGASFLGRAVNVAVVGTYPAWWFPMLIEVFHFALLVAAWRILPHHRIRELAD